MSLRTSRRFENSLYLTEPSARTLVLSATQGLNPAASSEPINLRDAARHPRFKLIPQCEEEPYHGFLGVPVIHRGETLGVVWLLAQVRLRR